MNLGRICELAGKKMEKGAPKIVFHLMRQHLSKRLK